MPSLYRLLSPALAVALIALCPLAVTQAQVTWDATSGNGTLQDGAGTWDAGTTSTWTTDGGVSNTTFTAGNNVTFGSGVAGSGSAGTVTIDNGGSALSVGNMTFNATPDGGNYTIAGNAAGDGLDFGTLNPVTIDVQQNATISAPITKAGGSGRVSITSGSDGFLTLSADNAATLGVWTDVNANTRLSLGHSNAAGSGRITLKGNDSRLQLENGVNVPNELRVDGEGNNKTLQMPDGTTDTATWGGNIVVGETTDRYFDLQANDSQTLTIEGRISGGGGAGINTISDGTIVLNGDNTFTGGAHLGDGTGSTHNGTSGNKHGFTVIGHVNALGTAKAISRGSQIQAASAGMIIGNAIDVNQGGLRVGGTNSFELSGLVSPVGGERTLGNYASAAGMNVTLSGGVNTNGQNINFQGASNNGGFIISSAITGTGNIEINSNMGDGVIVLSGTNTYTGNTLVSSAGGLDLKDAGQLLFDIEANGTNNAISGSGTAVFDGTFFFDLATATIADGNMWNIASVTTQSFGTTFDVNSSSGLFSDLGGSHQLVDGTNQWTFTESTGVLDLAVIPEPSSGALIALSCLALLRRRRRK